MTIGVVLTVVFIVLKLLGSIDWSWWLVVSPVLAELLISIIVATPYITGKGSRRLQLKGMEEE